MPFLTPIIKCAAVLFIHLGGKTQHKCLVQEVSRPGLELGPLPLESSALTMRPLHRPNNVQDFPHIFFMSYHFCSYFTKRPHVGGGEQNKKLGEYIRDKWISYKFDHVEMVEYDVLLSMPPRDKPNVVKILNTTDGSTLWNVQGPEKVRSLLLLLV